jgi:hypothetical protein
MPGLTDLSSCTAFALLDGQEVPQEAKPAHFGRAQSETEVLISTEVVAGTGSEGFIQVFQVTGEAVDGGRKGAEQEATSVCPMQGQGDGNTLSLLMKNYSGVT